MLPSVDAREPTAFSTFLMASFAGGFLVRLYCFARLGEDWFLGHEVS